MLPYTLHYGGEREVATGTCCECGVVLGEQGAFCSCCEPRYLDRRAVFTEYVRTLEEKLDLAPCGAIWAPCSVEGVGYYLSRLTPRQQGSTHRLSKIDLFGPGRGEQIAQVWWGRFIEDAVQQAVESARGFPLTLVPVESWEDFAPHPIFDSLYPRRPVVAQVG